MAVEGPLAHIFGVVTQKAAKEVEDLQREAVDSVVHAAVPVDDDPFEAIDINIQKVAGDSVFSSSSPSVRDVAAEDYYQQITFDPLKPLPPVDGFGEIPPLDPYEATKLQVSRGQLQTLCPEADYTVIWTLKDALDKAKAAIDAYFTPIVIHCETQLELPPDFQCSTTVMQQLEKEATRTPVQHIHEGLQFICRMSAEVMKDCQHLAAIKAADMAQHIATLEGRLQQYIQEAESSTPLVLPDKDVTSRGVKHAWGSSWWTKAKRERAAKYVEDQVHQWEQDDAKDSVAEELFAAIEKQFTQYLQLLEIEKQLGMHEEVQAALVQMRQGTELIKELDKEAKQMLACAQDDLLRLHETACSMENSDPERQKEAEEAISTHKNSLQAVRRKRLAVAERIVMDTKAYRRRKLELEDAMRWVGFTPAEIQLKDDMNGLKQLLIVVQRELEADGELWQQAEARRKAEWSADHTQQMDQLHTDLQALETHFQHQMAEAHHELQHLREQQYDLMHHHVALGLAERKRIAHMQKLLNNCEHHVEDLQKCMDSLKVEIEVLFKAQDVTRSLMGGIQGYYDHLRMKCAEEMPVLCLRALELGARLTDWHATMEMDKSSRILTLDQVLKNQFQMLEFYVDTKDPLAHKHQGIIIELQALRVQYQLDIQTHAETQAKYIHKCHLVDKLLFELLKEDPEAQVQRRAQYRELQNRWPNFFQSLTAETPAVDPSTFLASIELPEPPRSHCVAMKYPSTLLEVASLLPTRPNNHLQLTAEDWDVLSAQAASPLNQTEEWQQAAARGKGIVRAEEPHGVVAQAAPIDIDETSPITTMNGVVTDPEAVAMAALAKGKGIVKPFEQHGVTAHPPGDLLDSAPATNEVTVDDLPEVSDSTTQIPATGLLPSETPDTASIVPGTPGPSPAFEDFGSPGSAYVNQLRNEIAMLRRQLEDHETKTWPLIRSAASGKATSTTGRNLADELLQELVDESTVAQASKSVPIPVSELSDGSPISAGSRSKRYRLNKSSMLKTASDAYFDHRHFRLTR